MKRHRKIDGTRLAALREERYLNQSHLAALAGVAELTIGRLETGKTPHPQTSTVIKIAQALDVHPDELMETSSEASALEVRPFPQQLITLRRNPQADDVGSEGFSQEYPATG